MAEDLKQYTVFGLYPDNLQRWSDGYLAKDAAEAILLARAQYDDGMLIAAVVEGDIRPVDTGMYGEDDE